ncbi:MAG: hypothetical protein WB441_03230 [Nocardioidaceae bacterium]
MTEQGLGRPSSGPTRHRPPTVRRSVDSTLLAAAAALVGATVLAARWLRLRRR